MHHRSMRARLASVAAAGVVATTALAVAPQATAAIPAATAAAEGGIKVTLPISGEATIAKRDTTLHLPEGAQMVGELVGNTVTGDLTIPPATAKMRILDIPKIGDTTSTVRIVGTAPAVTTLNPDGSVTVVNRFRIEIPRVSSDLLPSLNIVKETCRSKEITATLHGPKFELFAPFPLEGTFTIPKFEQCGWSFLGLPSARDLLLSELLSGPDNTMKLMAGPTQFG